MIQWLIDNWQGILGVLGAAHVVALAVVNLTPTPNDNEALEKVYKWVERIGGIFTGKAKQ